ncbi:hypothetical protein RMSM_06038 [Rhodopirellula maiorica SM1]|uniref:Uncharacterized protein n=1 Tax=Rhodopirellula maiorica SM1 TaxID=1265738 RepID=M5RSU4_9BACT|nr:hypothetical protein RMSM_06038 [Rhodopirellula maiorica SM1]
MATSPDDSARRFFVYGNAAQKSWRLSLPCEYLADGRLEAYLTPHRR